ncbi:MAG TPA: hydrogenase maturation protease [bacterium (Candidatus Stahlbacteria)]|nr:hydrogenase maturation protease [Candidatus Stahlbacteria bacterium]
MIKIIGCGNILKGDDGVGVYVLRELKKLNLPDEVELIDVGTQSLNILSYVGDAEEVIIIDAVMSGNKPGTIYCNTAEELTLSNTDFISSHELKWYHILAVGSKIMENLKSKVTVFGIEVGNVKTEIGLSPELKATIPKVVNLIHKQLQF